MAKELPASAVEIANVAEVAGQLGIKAEDILTFSRTMIDMGRINELERRRSCDSHCQDCEYPRDWTSDEYGRFGGICC